MNLCIITDCGRKSRSVGMCQNHYYQFNEVGKAANLLGKLKTRLSAVGWSYDRWQILLYAQNGLCYICGQSDYSKGFNLRLAADHNHETGEPRGILCRACNQAVGIYENKEREIHLYLYKGNPPISIQKEFCLKFFSESYT